MGNLILLSSIDEKLNHAFKDEIQSIVSEHGSRLGYIPSQYDETRFYFNKTKPFLEDLGFDAFVYADIDQEFEDHHLEELKKCDAIYLSGGNTFYFLNNLKKRGMIPFLKEFVERGGILIGVSAGAMIMTTSIESAHFLDLNEIGLDDLNGLGLVDVHFLPHSDKVVDQMEEVRTSLAGTVYACKDGAGLIVQEDGTVQTYGTIERWK